MYDENIILRYLELKS